MNYIKIILLFAGLTLFEKSYSKPEILLWLDSADVVIVAKINDSLQDSTYKLEIMLRVKNQSKAAIVFYFSPNNDFAFESNGHVVSNNKIHPFTGSTESCIKEYDLTRFNMGIPGNKNGYLFPHKSVTVLPNEEQTIYCREGYKMKDSDLPTTGVVFVRIIYFKDSGNDDLIKSQLKLNSKEYEKFISMMIEKQECVEIIKRINVN